MFVFHFHANNVFVSHAHLEMNYLNRYLKQKQPSIYHGTFDQLYGGHDVKAIVIYRANH